MLTFEQIAEIVHDIKFPGFRWQLRGTFENDGAVTLHATFDATDIETGGLAEQSTRKWLLSKYMVTGEVVQTALKCVLTAIEHEARECFTYRGQPVFGPHFSIEELVRLCLEQCTQVREEVKPS
ncbi:hypothetical protein BH10PSE18_BH10PSE18_18740 [soil metagenome]